MKTSLWMCVLLPLLALSCADSGPVTVDARWNLTCPADSAAGCGSLAKGTCLGVAGQREIVGAHRQESCTGDPILATCEAVPRSDGTTNISLEVSVLSSNNRVRFGFELSGATIDTVDGTVQETACNVTITEDELAYNIGGCGIETPSMLQPCQLSNIDVTGSSVTLDLECDSLLSSTSDLGFDVGAVGGGPTTIQFANCRGI